MKVFILGSCVSRDVLERANSGEFELVEYIARSSIGSMFAGSPFPDTFSSRISSNFQRRLVRLDILKEGQHQLATIDADVLLMDLIDERFDLLETTRGKCCTISVELKRSGAVDEVAGSTVIRSASDLHLHYWNNGWTALVELLKSRSMLHKVRVNAVLWQRHTESGAPFTGPSLENIDAANEALETMYARMALDLEPGQFFRYSDDVMKCPDGHPWDTAPFHYSEAFNQAALSNLRQASHALR